MASLLLQCSFPLDVLEGRSASQARLRSQVSTRVLPIFHVFAACRTGAGLPAATGIIR
jgi:hypothetical protein